MKKQDNVLINKKENRDCVDNECVETIEVVCEDILLREQEREENDLIFHESKSEGYSDEEVKSILTEQLGQIIDNNFIEQANKDFKTMNKNYFSLHDIFIHDTEKGKSRNLKRYRTFILCAFLNSLSKKRILELLINNTFLTDKYPKKRLKKEITKVINKDMYVNSEYYFQELDEFNDNNDLDLEEE